MKRMLILAALLLVAKWCKAVDYTYSTNLYGANSDWLPVYAGTNSVDSTTNRDAYITMVNKLNHMGAKFQQMLFDVATNGNVLSNRVNTVSNRINSIISTNGATTSGQIVYFTNSAPYYFWSAAPTGGGGGGATSGITHIDWTNDYQGNIIFATNKLAGTNLYALKTDATNAATAVTNGFPWGGLYDAAGKAQQATNDFINTSTNIAQVMAQRATNGLGSAAFTATSAYDASGVALAATNGFVNTATNIAQTMAQRATNGLGSAAFTASSAYDASGAAQAATNGLASGAFATAKGTNGFITAADFPTSLTNQFLPKAITGMSAFLTGNSASGAELVITNADATAWAGWTIQMNDGTVTTNYFGAYGNNSSFTSGATYAGGPHDGIIELAGANMIFSLIGGNSHLLFITRQSTNGTMTTNFDLTATASNFKTQPQFNGSNLLTHLDWTNDFTGNIILATNKLLGTNYTGNHFVSGTAISSNGFYSTVSNSFPLTTVAITASKTNFFTNTFGFSVLIGYSGITITGLGMTGTNAGVGGDFKKWMGANTNGTIGLRPNHVISITNGATAGNLTWEPFP